MSDTIAITGELLSVLLKGAARKLAQPKSLVPVSPETLYHMVFQEVSRRIVDPSWLPADWDSWQHKFDGSLRSTEEAVVRANEMLRSVKDWFTYLSSPEEVRRENLGLAGIGISCGYQVDERRNFVLHADGSPLPLADGDGHPIISVNPGGAAYRAGLRTGDTLARIDGQDTVGRSLRWLWRQVTGLQGTYVTLLLGKSESKLAWAVSIQRQALAAVRSAETREIGSGIGYINLRDFSPEAVSQMEGAFCSLRNCKALILDLRENIGGVHSAALAISSMFIERGELVATEERLPGPAEHPSYVRNETSLFDDELVVRSFTGGGAPKVSRSRRQPFMARGKQVVVLIGGNTISCAELFAGAVKDNQAAVLIGTCTAGKGIGQLPLEMPNGTRLEVTVDRFFTPSGNWPGDGGNRVANGVSPDFVVEPETPVFDPGSRQDNQLDAAVSFLSKKQ